MSHRMERRLQSAKWPAVIGIMLVATAFRLLALNDVPPGLHHDEVIIGQIAKDILRGRLAIYFTAGYGHEPLYHYLLAGLFALLGANAFVLRLTSAFVALLGLAITYRFTRRVFSPIVALGTLAWMAVSLWPVFFARLGLRGITLPLLSTLTAYLLWKALRFSPMRSESQATRAASTRGLHAKRPASNLQLPTSNLQPPTSNLQPPTSHFIPHPSPFILPGILLGLTLYTYQASRVFPIIFGVFALYLLLFHRNIFKQRRRGIAVFFTLAAIVAAPLAIYLTVINPAAEERVADLSGPLLKLAAGDLTEVIHSTLNTLGMFTIVGDAVLIYNVGGRPVFPEPAGAALFYLGVWLCLWRWRQPGYAFVLIWMAISLVPAMVTPFSPNFVRTIAAWPIPFVLCGLAMLEISQFVRKFTRHSVTLSTHHSSRHIAALSPVTRHLSLVPHHLATIIFVLALAANALLTARDYFLDWPRGDYVRFWQQTTWTQAARALGADPSSLPVAASGLSIHDLDPQTFDLLANRPDLKVKWFDCRNAILFPGGGAAARYLSPDFFPCDPELWARYLPGAALIAQPRWPDSGNVIFSLHQFDAGPLLDAILPRVTSQPIFAGGESFNADDLQSLALPIDLSGLRLLGWELERETWKPGEAVEVMTYWQVTASLAPPLSLFVHITGSDGTIIAQSDGLDVGVATLGVGDVFVQRHRLALPLDALAGVYRVSLGAYQPDTGARLIAVIGERHTDALILGLLNLVN